MVIKMVENMAVTNGTDGLSPAANLDGNAVQLTATIANLGGATSLTIVLEGSLDLNNWSTVATYSSLGYGFNAPAKTTGIAFAFVRLKLTVVGSGTVIVSAVINTSMQ